MNLKENVMYRKLAAVPAFSYSLCSAVALSLGFNDLADKITRDLHNDKHRIATFSHTLPLTTTPSWTLYFDVAVCASQVFNNYPTWKLFNPTRNLYLFSVARLLFCLIG